MKRINILCKRIRWRVLAVITATILALTLIGSQAVIARGGPTVDSGGQPTVGAPPDETGGPPDGKGEESEDTGNNLSYPVIWSDGPYLSLRGACGTESFFGEWWYWWGEEGVDPDIVPLSCAPDPDNDTYCDDGVAGTYDESNVPGEGWVKAYLQQDAGNQWQAGSADWSGSTVEISTVDWGDNLEAKDWSADVVLRVETVLYQDLSASMRAYNMHHLYGQGPDEMWGCDMSTYQSFEATVYSGCARLTIQKLSDNYSDSDLTWDASTGEWTGAGVASTIYNSGVWQGVEGPDSRLAYSAEINVSGKVIYGYNWNLRNNSDGDGYYRITFSLDNNTGHVPLNTFITENTVIKVSAEDSEATEAEPGGGGVAVIDSINNLTYIDLNILPARSGGGNKPIDAGGGGKPEGAGGGGRR